MRSSEHRRSSAASSRHNSLSSTQSHQSHSSSCSYSRKPVSSHVAQHLRRASIIESRKARLADRAAYAEQVRQRAAMAKAAPRASNLEEKAQAAQIAREKYLAGVAATCAEEVRRAKKIAEAMKEKRLADNLKLRSDMQEKLAEAERRRAEYQSARRFVHSSTNSTDPTRHRGQSRLIQEAKAAKRIQSAWRIRLRQKIVNDFLQLNLMVDKVREQDFDAVSAQLENETVIDRTTKLLKLLGLKNNSGTDADHAVSRIFLSAFLILSHPTSVFISDGDQEKDLMSKSTYLLISFENRVFKLDSTNEFQSSPDDSLSFQGMFDVFSAAFSAWKSQDLDFLVAQMLESFQQLDNLRRVIAYEPSEILRMDFEEAIKNQQISLIVRLKRLMGPEKAMKLVRDGLEQSRRVNRRKRMQIIRPRGSSTLGIAQYHGLLKNDNSTEFSDRLEIIGTNQLDAEKDKTFQAASMLPPNRVLVHEVAIDQGMDLAERTHSGRQNSLKEVAQFCEVMRHHTSKEYRDFLVITLIKQVRERLLNIVSLENPLNAVINEVLDPILIKNQVEAEIFSYEQFFSFLEDVLPKICSPGRDEEVKELANDNSSDYIARIPKLLSILNHLSLDYAQYMLSTNMPALLREAPGYESRKFEEDLREKVHGLERTERWWRQAKAQLLLSNDTLDRGADGHASKQMTCNDIYLQGLSDLLLPRAETDDDLIPETLQLDKDRIVKARVSLLNIISSAGILLKAKILLRQEPRSQWSAEISSSILDLTRDFYFAPHNPLVTSQSPNDPEARYTSRIFSAITSSYTLADDDTEAQLSSFIERTLVQNRQRSFTDPILRLLSQRLYSYVTIRIKATKTDERVRLASTATEALTAAGFAEFAPQIGDLVNKIVRVGALDRVSHGHWYEEVAAKVAVD